MKVWAIVGWNGRPFRKKESHNHDTATPETDRKTKAYETKFIYKNIAIYHDLSLSHVTYRFFFLLTGLKIIEHLSKANTGRREKAKRATCWRPAAGLGRATQCVPSGELT